MLSAAVPSAAASTCSASEVMQYAAPGAAGEHCTSRQTLGSSTAAPSVLSVRFASTSLLSPVPQKAMGAPGETAQQVKIFGVCFASPLTSVPLAVGTSQERIRPPPSQQTSSPLAALMAMPLM